MRKFLAISAAALGVSGCSAVRSTPVDFSDAGVRSGLHYAAPKGLFYVELVDVDRELRLRISEPFYVGDPNASYMLEGAASTWANEEYRVQVDPQTRLLYYINSRSEGQAGQILTNLVRSAAAIGGAGGGAPSGEFSGAPGSDTQPRVIFRRIVDPFQYARCDFGTACDFAALNQELRQAALGYFECTPAAANNPKAAICGRLRSDPNYLSLSLTPLFEAEGAAALAGATAEQCRAAICYRAPAPYALGLRVAGVTDQTEVVHLPNEAPVMSLAVPAGVFATSRTRIEMMVDGMPATYTIDRRNELVAVTLMPFTLVREGFAAIGEVFTFRINYNNQRIRQLESEQRREEAEDRYRQRNAETTELTEAARREGDAPPTGGGGQRQALNAIADPFADTDGAQAQPSDADETPDVAAWLMAAPLEVSEADADDDDDAGAIGSNQ